MPDKILKSAIFRSRKQASRNHRKISLLTLHPLRFFVVLSLMLATFCPLSLSAQRRDDSMHQQISSDISSYIVKEIDNSKVLMAKDVDRPVSPASLTKIMTCIMAIESGRLEQEVVIPKEATMVEPSIAGFKRGDRIKLVDLVKAAMVNSSNDAAFAIAIYLSGNVDAFVSAMNQKAKMIGMKNSCFTNPAGFDKGRYAGNISTAGDLLRLTEYSVRNPLFNAIARLERVDFTELTTGKVYSLSTHNKLLDRYPYAVGIKTGYTSRAGGCLIARAIKDRKDVLLVMLNAKTDRWNAAASMFDQAFMINSSEPGWFVESPRGDSGRAVKEVVKGGSKLAARSMAHTAYRSKRQALAQLKLSKKSKQNSIAQLNVEKRLKRRELAMLKAGKGSKSHAVAGVKAVRTSKVVVAGLKSNKQSKSNAVAMLNAGKRSKSHSVAGIKDHGMAKDHVVAVIKANKKTKSGAFALSTSARKSRKRELVSSKPARKSRKRVAVISDQASVTWRQPFTV